ncbi:alkaline phosphatase [Erythrobacter sp. HL-111]|uniref:alkaline phosphatase D family protein n=1 Tax=Erythrobacter sp. HL-111 TaxID=1798193 RepID=UPI0006DB953D|nr:alkaline phosphatase D family protein [Erythrobacter sp. HL-111]KPP88348.1 MAG: alkaline phosphatase PhoD [Erythrobacteraceae bacterium HL-111]SDS81782.1 alkaline phosphatase D [Erythrobacter sp. HL-111]
MSTLDSAAAAPAPASTPTATTGVSRRGLFALAGAASALAATPAGARSWGSGFTHSVASGEPQADSVLLWTRFVGEAETALEWEVSESADFARVVASGTAAASSERDWCAKATASGLAPDRWYYYRFVAPGGTTSDIGRTRTLPEGPTQAFRLAVFSCSNFGFGWFNAYAHAAEANDCDLAVHLGDYIYEYGGDTYPAQGQRHPDRTLAPGNEIVTLADYRTRYATYRADPDLRRLHQSLPMIAVWDDHESANDSWTGGAENHQPETEGDWATRKAIAKRVYREWMPVSDEPYAAYDIGDLATIFRLDTRLEGRDEQLDFGAVLEGVTDPEKAVAALTAFRDGEWSDPERQLLGERQERWLAEGLAASTARGAKWQVLAQQVLIGNLKSPAALVAQIEGSLPDFVRQRLTAAALASEAGLPLNMDAWDGYPAARERVFEAALAADANLVVLAGDTHNAWAFDLDHDGAKVGVEFGTASVSSPGFENYLSFVKPGDLAGALVAENAQLKWADTSQRGYMTVELTPARATTEFRFVEGIRTRQTRLAGTRRIATVAGTNTLEA